jgi:receptor protein-tyrosine kinase
MLLNLAVGALFGLLLGAGGSLARHRLDRSVKDSDEVALLAGAPVIGTIFRDEALTNRHVVDLGKAASRSAEDFRRLRTNLQFLNVDRPPRVIMITSALPAEGKTTLVVNLALALADAGRRVTIVEADLRRPKVPQYLGMVGDVGLTNILAGTADIAEVVQTYRDGMQVIAAGPMPPNPGELLASSNMAAVLEKLRGENDIVLVDAAPLLPVVDSAALAVAMDGVLLSVRYGSTRKDQLKLAVASLERVGATTLGVILNIVPPRSELATAYGYGYGYEHGGRHATNS